MNTHYKNDVFISYHHGDEPNVKTLFETMQALGLRVFLSSKKLERGREFPNLLIEELKNCQHFALYWSNKTNRSKWVTKEADIFYNQCYMRDKENRRMYIYIEPSCTEEDLPSLYREFNRPKNPESLVHDIVQIVLESTRNICESAIEDQNDKILELEQLLQNEQKKVAEAQGYYRYNRFWGSISKTKNVHIFTCARDTEYNPESHRGSGGRTNIDLWDYRAVLDITKFLAINFPNVSVSIEDPISKLHGEDLEKPAPLADKMTHMRSLIENKDCIIIGSPDVNDFAEIVLSAIHSISPYTEGRHKEKGFVVIKERVGNKSSFYWQKNKNDKEGVAEIQGPEKYIYYPHKIYDSGGVTYGILIVANNPFCKDVYQRKIIILSGFTGVATNALAKLLTDERCLPEFFKLDNAYADTDKDIEALIKVNYKIDDNFSTRDTRKLNISNNSPIVFDALVEL